MKKILIPAVLILVAAFISACSADRLEIPQKGVLLTQDFYNTDEDCEAAMVAAYRGLIANVCSQEGGSIYAPFRACFDLPGDDMYAAGSNYGDNDFMREMNEFTFGPNTAVLVNCYNNLFYAMYYSNIVIDKFKDGLPDGGQTPTTKRCVAEARVLRAWMQLMLTAGWGCPPLVDHVLEYFPLEEIYRCDEHPTNPMSHEQMFEWCAKECEAARADLDERQGAGDKAGTWKVTKGFADAVAGKAYLFAGNYAAAKTALKRVIDSGNYELVPTARWNENFHASGDGNEEKIFETNLVNGGGLGWGDITFSGTWMEANIWGWRGDHFVYGNEGEVKNNPWSIKTNIDGWGGLGVPKDFADEWLAFDGKESVRFSNSLIHIDDVIYNTHYGHEVDNMTLEQKKASKAFGIKVDGLYGQSFYLAQKQAIKPFEDAWYPGANQRFNNFVIMRYAEVLLMYAEAALQTGDAAQATWAFNKVHERAGAKPFNGAVDMNAIKKEKKFELWLEMCRWPDQVRWGDFEKSKLAGSNVPILYDKLFRAPQGSDEDVIWENGSEANSRFYTVRTHEAKDNGLSVGYVAGKEYFPFPSVSDRQNPTLNQLPFWSSGSAE
jgi:SusD family.